MRASDVAGGGGRRSQAAGLLLPCLAMRPGGDSTIDAEKLSRELAYLAAVGRRGSSS